MLFSSKEGNSGGGEGRTIISFWLLALVIAVVIFLVMVLVIPSALAVAQKITKEVVY